MHLRFEDPSLERFYVNGIAPEGVEREVLEYCQDAFAVLVAATSVGDFRSLQAFRPTEVIGRPSGRLAVAVGGGWRLIFSVEAEGTARATAHIKQLSKAAMAAQRISQ